MRTINCSTSLSILGRPGVRRARDPSNLRATSLRYHAKDPPANYRCKARAFGTDGIIPFAVEFVAHDVHGSEFVVGYFDAGRVGHGIELATDLETGSGGGCGDQLHDPLMADERLSPPVAGDEREEAMLDLVPLAGAGRQVTDGDRDIEFVGQLLQLQLPQPHP